MATKPEGDFQLLDITGRQSEQKCFGGEIGLWKKIFKKYKLSFAIDTSRRFCANLLIRGFVSALAVPVRKW